MAALNDYIQQITDPALRQRLAEEADRLAQHTTFGLVFEEHVPEYTLLNGLSIRRGSTVIRINSHIPVRRPHIPHAGARCPCAECPRRRPLAFHYRG